MSPRFTSYLIYSVVLLLASCGKQNHAEDPFSRTLTTRVDKEIKSPFSSKSHKKESRQRLESPFSSKISKVIERSSLSDHFTRIKEDKPRAALADAFTHSSTSNKPLALQDYFSSSKKESKSADLQDHFSNVKKEVTHREEDLHSKGAQRKVFRKNFIGERFRLFNKDPNSTRSKRKSLRKHRKKKDPFSRNSRKHNQPQSPRGEGDLFPNGVLPKMDDPR